MTSLIMRSLAQFTKAAGIVLVSLGMLFASGCATNPVHDWNIVFGESKFYRFKPVAAPFPVAKIQCKHHLVNRLLGVDAFVACMADQGWLPCHEGGESRPECKAEE